MEENLNESKELMKKEDNYQVLGFEDLGKNTTTKTEVITNITDEKKIFNLEKD